MRYHFSRRTHERRPLADEIEVFFEGKSIEATGRDVSAGGILLATNTDIPLGKPLSVLFSTTGEDPVRVLLTGVIVRKTKAPERGVALRWRQATLKGPREDLADTLSVLIGMTPELIESQIVDGPQENQHVYWFDRKDRPIGAKSTYKKEKKQKSMKDLGKSTLERLGLKRSDVKSSQAKTTKGKVTAQTATAKDVISRDAMDDEDVDLAVLEEMLRRPLKRNPKVPRKAAPMPVGPRPTPTQINDEAAALLPPDEPESPQGPRAADPSATEVSPTGPNDTAPHAIIPDDHPTETDPLPALDPDAIRDQALEQVREDARQASMTASARLPADVRPVTPTAHTPAYPRPPAEDRPQDPSLPLPPPAAPQAPPPQAPTPAAPRPAPHDAPAWDPYAAPRPAAPPPPAPPPFSDTRPPQPGWTQRPSEPPPGTYPPTDPRQQQATSPPIPTPWYADESAPRYPDGRRPTYPEGPPPPAPFTPSTPPQVGPPPPQLDARAPAPGPWDAPGPAPYGAPPVGGAGRDEFTEARPDVSRGTVIRQVHTEHVPVPTDLTATLFYAEASVQVRIMLLSVEQLVFSTVLEPVDLRQPMALRFSLPRRGEPIRVTCTGHAERVRRDQSGRVAFVTVILSRVDEGGDAGILSRYVRWRHDRAVKQGR